MSGAGHEYETDNMPNREGQPRHCHPEPAERQWSASEGSVLLFYGQSDSGGFFLHVEGIGLSIGDLLCRRTDPSRTAWAIPPWPAQDDMSIEFLYVWCLIRCDPASSPAPTGRLAGVLYVKALAAIRKCPHRITVQGEMIAK